MPLILASSSVYRRRLLSRLGLPFEWQSPDVDETPHTDESSAALSARLALAKAAAVAELHPEALIIGSDQTADLNGLRLDKPGTPEKAFAQLSALSGRTLVFHTSLCLLDAASDRRQQTVVDTRVRFRSLDGGLIRRYIERDQPLDCAGSFKVESLGIALFEAVESDDPTALEGLPLIALCQMLRQRGLDPLSA